MHNATERSFNKVKSCRNFLLYKNEVYFFFLLHSLFLLSYIVHYQGFRAGFSSKVHPLTITFNNSFHWTTLFSKILVTFCGEREEEGRTVTRKLHPPNTTEFPTCKAQRKISITALNCSSFHSLSLSCLSTILNQILNSTLFYYIHT